MFNGAHVVVYTTDAEADRRFFRDELKLSNIDAGGGWLIFALPPAEVAFHPHDSSHVHELYLMCEDIAACRKALSARGVESAEVTDEGWGLLSSFRLPGGGSVGFYQPRHGRPA
jgi:catechol 2,3-dioxygenase-like lactoylglutathione lyase family enzyme